MRDVGALVGGGNPVTTSGLDVLTGLNTPLAVRLFGQDPVVLGRPGRPGPAMLMAGVDGVVDPQIRHSRMQPTIEIEVDLEKAQQLGVTPGRRAPRRGHLVAGHPGRQRLRGPEGLRRRSSRACRRPAAAWPTSGTCSSTDPAAGHVGLGEVADVRTVETPAVISRDAVSRRVDIVAGMDGRERERRSRPTSSSGWRDDGLPARVPRRGAAARAPPTRSAPDAAIGFAVAAVLAAFLLFQAAFRSWRLAAGDDRRRSVGPGRAGWSPACSPSASFRWGRCSACWPSSAWPPGRACDDLEPAALNEGCPGAVRSWCTRRPGAAAAGPDLHAWPSILLASAVRRARHPSRTGDRCIRWPSCCSAVWSPPALVTLFVLPALYRHAGPAGDRSADPVDREPQP